MGKVIETFKIGNLELRAPYKDLLRPLTPGEYIALERDISKRGRATVSIVIDEDGNIIDGYHRARITSELGLKQIEVDIIPGLSEEDKCALALELNEHRRHLTPDEIAELARRKRGDGKSTRQIAEELGIDHSTVVRSGGASAPPEQVNGRDGKSYPSQRTTKQGRKERQQRARELRAQGWTIRQIADELGVSVGTIQKDLKLEKDPIPKILATSATTAQKALDNLQEIEPGQLPKKTIDTKQLGRKAREIAKEQERQNGEPDPIRTPTLDLRFGDFRKVLDDVSDNSVNLVFTDPPYAKEYLPLWAELAEWAARVLKPGGLLISYTGQYYLPDVMDSLAKHLSYVWLGAIKTHGPKNIVHQRKFYAKCKPLLFYSKGKYRPLDFVDDFIDDDKPEKDAHEWQQGIAPALYYIEKVTPLGGIVADPFLGTGTTGEAALKLGRCFVGAEKEQKTFRDAKERLGSLS